MKYDKNEAKQWAKENIHGAFVTMSVPETSKYEIDEKSIRQDIRHYLEICKVQGIYVPGLYGNFYAFTVDERKRIIETVVNEVNHKVPVVCHCEHECLKDSLDLIKNAEDIGVDLIAITGPWLGNSHDVIMNYFEHVASNTEIGIIVDNITSVGYGINPETLAHISKIPNVAILKNLMPMAQTIQLRQLVGDTILVVDPNEENLLVNMVQFGQKSVFSGSPMMYDSKTSTPMHDYLEAGLNGDVQRCSELYYDMQPLRDLYEKWVINPWNNTGVFPLTTVKFWVHQLGLTGGPTRPPAIEMSDIKKQELIEDLRKVGKLPI